MNGYNFTERVRKILAMAREEAARLHNAYVGPEHILLGIVRERKGVGAAVLLNRGTDFDALATAIDARAAAATVSGVHIGPDLPYTQRGKRTLELAMAEARELNHAYVGSEHLLLGLLREETGIAAQVLNASGVTLASVRTETLRVLGNAAPGSTSERLSQAAAAPHTFGGAPDIAPRTTDQLREQVAWNRLTRALDVGQRLGTPPAITLEPDGTLTVPLGPDLVVSVEFPPGVRLRRREAGQPPGGPTPSAQEPA